MFNNMRKPFDITQYTIKIDGNCIKLGLTNLLRWSAFYQNGFHWMFTPKNYKNIQFLL